MKRFIIKIHGIVQGVGFRPFVFRIANRYHIKGFIKNEGSYVFIDGEGIEENCHQFVHTIKKQPPIQARIDNIEIDELSFYGYNDFKIIKSQVSKHGLHFISPDIGMCDACLKDIHDKDSRFYQYSFTTCTDCGPRFSIINTLPYDRHQTTMVNFPMCIECRNDYLNPTSRRFHAQSIACPHCGPKLTLFSSTMKFIQSSDIINDIRELIKKGKILAIKGIGGFHLCCDAKNDQTVLNLRKRKNRKTKPLAVMARNMEVVKQIAYLNHNEEQLLLSKERPIVLLRKKEDSLLSKHISGNSNKIGVFLPYTPLHALLLEKVDVVVLTSGNKSKQHIEYRNDHVVNKLQGVADYFLLHNRDILHPVDDSVVKAILNKKQTLRLGRGLVPMSFPIGHQKKMLACGVDEKASYAFSQKGYATLYPYIGHLNSLSCFEYYKNSIKEAMDLCQLKPDYIIIDKNPHFLSSQFASNLKGQIIPVYHHHAHMASCMGEFDIYDDVIGVIFDGTGVGCDGSIWGSEFLVGNRTTFKRMAHLEEILIQGNDVAMKEIKRIAYSYLKYFNLNYDLPINETEKRVIDKALKQEFNCFKTTSMGRLFDGVSYLLGIIDEVTYDGEAAIQLENIAVSDCQDDYDVIIEKQDNEFLFKLKNLFMQLIDDLTNNVSKEVIATKYHNTIVKMISQGVRMISEMTGIKTIVLSGGVFQNDYLLTNVYQELVKKGYKVYFNQKVPINDNGIAFGQLIIGGSMVR